MKKKLFILFAVMLALVVVPAVAAQGVATLAYGSSATGTLSAEAPLSLYLFSGNAGDLITAEVLGLEPGMAPTISLLGPNQQVLSTGTLDAFSAGSRSATLTRFLPNAGAYTLLVGGTPGQYLVLLNATPALTTTTPLTLPATTSITLNPDAEQVLTFANASPNAVALAVSGGSSSAPFSVAVYNTDGHPLAAFSGAVGDVCIGIPGGTGNFMAILEGENAGQPLDVGLSAAEGRCSSLSAAAPQTQQPVQQQPVATQQPSGQTAACTVSSGSTVNVRSGPGTNYGIITTLQAGVQAPVVGTSDSGWVVIQINGVQGFVSQTVVGTFGNCAGLPFIPAPPVGQQPQPVAPTATTPPQQPLPTATQEQQQQPPTATQAQQQPPPTATEPPPPTATQAVQVAPPDSNYALNIQLDGNGAVSDVVSYPDGDTEDVVSYAVNGLNNSVALSGGQANLTFTFTCSGTGTQYVVFIVDGQTKTCGQTHVRVVNADSRTGAVRVRATGGDGTYVQWTVNAAAPRVN